MHTYYFCTHHGNFDNRIFFFEKGQNIPEYFEHLGTEQGDTPGLAYIAWFRKINGEAWANMSLSVYVHDNEIEVN